MNSLRELTFHYKRPIAILFILSVITAAALIFQGYFLVSAVESVFLKQVNFSGIIWVLIGLLAALLLRTITSYANSHIGVKMAADVKANYRKALLHKFRDTPIKQSAQGQSGGKISILLDSIDEMDSYFSEYIPQLIQTSIIPLVILVIVFTQHVNTGLIMIITAPFIPIFMIIIGMRTKKKSEEQQEKMTAFAGHFLDTLQGLTTLKLFSRAKDKQDALERSSLNFRDATMEILKVAFMSSFMLELISMLSIGLVALELAIQMIIYERVTFFTAFFILVLVPEFYSFLKQLGSSFHNGRTSMGAANKVIAALEEKDQPVQWGDQMLSSNKMPPTIDLDTVSFEYGEGQFSLNQISTNLPKYGQIAIVGRSGSGKTTLLHLIAGLLPASNGKITLNGTPLTHYRERDWFDQLSYISQHPYIFSGTIAENIALGGDPNSSRAEIERAAEAAGVAEMVQSLEEGYDTPIGEGGRGLSGGEMQRLAIARAFLKQPAIILFDEPTTGLDLYTEGILQQSIKQLGKDATVITVAHRLHTIKHADKILFLEDGILIAEGTHQRLIDHIPEYRQMVTVQQGGKAE
ncbi:thiol reductant ABC exporter subunit CydD [Lentibacillus amyloliquefaciens]|uniref:ABC transporter ATP-binding protein n=1 Tax=Lentibacillus amyloliquefaciens TaxID=1472767 RepID=A0A0U4F3M8_9BACI|nr:thiol reductant ABC exporter subunit CydD [Lentibacillus amyloliquefaciens]ALX47331.1 ABC transporter ATP-binding protein [Lentibacillus amyloliquefaciens]